MLKPSEVLITYGDESKTIKEWARTHPVINENSARVRLSMRQNGRRDCTDSDVLFGYGKDIDSFLFVSMQPRDHQDGWEVDIISELNNRIIRMPLQDAVIQAIKAVFGDVFRQKDENSHPIFTAAGREYEKDGMTLSELCDVMDYNIQAVKVFMEEDWGLSVEEISKLIKEVD